MKTIYRIYPAIGIARIGNSETGYFLGPESPGIVPAMDPIVTIRHREK